MQLLQNLAEAVIGEGKEELVDWDPKQTNIGGNISIIKDKASTAMKAGRLLIAQKRAWLEENYVGWADLDLQHQEVLATCFALGCLNHKRNLLPVWAIKKELKVLKQELQLQGNNR